MCTLLTHSPSPILSLSIETLFYWNGLEPFKEILAILTKLTQKCFYNFNFEIWHLSRYRISHVFDNICNLLTKHHLQKVIPFFNLLTAILKLSLWIFFDKRTWLLTSLTWSRKLTLDFLLFNITKNSTMTYVDIMVCFYFTVWNQCF